MALLAGAAGIALVLAVGVSGLRAAQTALPLRVVGNVSLPGPSNRFDYQSLDIANDRLYISHMDAGQLLVFSLRSHRVVRTIAAPGVHGVLVVPSLHRVYASATDVHQLYTIDGRSGRVIARAPAGSYPDGLAFDSREGRIYVSDETGGIESVFNAAGRRVGTVDLGGDAGNVQYDPKSGHILVAVQSRGDVAVIDPRTNRVVRRVSLRGCDHPHGLLVDAPRHIAFVACDGNAALLTLDLNTWTVMGTASVGPSPDVLALDTESHWLYVAAESGQVAVFAERGRTLHKLGQAEIAPAAHTVAVDPRTHRAYFPLQTGSSGGPQLRITAPG